MSFWKNKHVLVATVAAPVLGLVSYFGFGALFGEKPQPAEVTIGSDTAGGLTIVINRESEV